jgi:hypothetical protein
MALWTDLIDPATLTGYARASLADYEARKGTLARWLPNREVPTSSCASSQGQTGLVDDRGLPRLRRRADHRQGPAGQARHARAPRARTEHPGLGVQPAPRSQRRPTTRSSSRDPEHHRPCRASRSPTRSSVSAASSSPPARRRSTRRTSAAPSMDDDFGRAAGTPSPPAPRGRRARSPRLGPADLVDTYVGSNGEEPGAILMSTGCCGRSPRARRVQDAAPERWLASRHPPTCRTILAAPACRRSTSTTATSRSPAPRPEGHPRRPAAAAPRAGRDGRLGGHRARRDVLGSDPVVGRGRLGHRGRPSSPASSRASTATRSPR